MDTIRDDSKITVGSSIRHFDLNTSHISQPPFDRRLVVELLGNNVNKMEDKPLTESINKQYSKYGSLRTKERESRIELCNAEDPMKFLTRIDSSIKDAKARVKQSIDKSTISEDLYESSYDQQHTLCDSAAIDTIPMVMIDRNKSGSSLAASSSSASPQPSSSFAAAATPAHRPPAETRLQMNYDSTTSQ